jgi:AraC-like DNA-binding protein
MERSRLLLDSGHDVKDVARTLNYAESRAFTSAFKKYFGHTPSIFYELVE